MSKQLVPTGEDFEKEKVFFATATEPDLVKRAEELEFSNKKSYVKCMRDHGATRSYTNAVTSPPSPSPSIVYETRTIPQEFLKIDRIKPTPAKKGDEEHQIVVIGDQHVGHSTVSFNSDSYIRRMKNFQKNTMLIASLHRNMYPLNELWMLFLGDNVHGERVGKQVSLDEMDTMVDKYGTRHVMGVSNQIHDVLIPATVNCILNFLQFYKVIHLRGVPGNHGANEKWNSLRCNWDLEYYRNLKSAFMHEKRVDADFEVDNFYQKVGIQDHTFFLVHGDQIPMHIGVPWFGIERRVLNWNASIKDFDYVVMGHFHFIGEDDVNGIPVFLNGTFCSDDKWTLNKLGKKGTLAQRTLGVHKKEGVTWQYNVKLEKTP